jgi:hypothetical protein
MSGNSALVRNRMQNGQLNLMRRASLVAEEVFKKNARRGSIFAATVKQEDVRALTIGKIHLLGAVTFVLGSVAYVYGEGSTDWLLEYRIGCGYFIVGSISYLVAMSMSRGIHDGASNQISDVLIWTAMILFIVGCGLGFSPGVTETGRRMVIANWMFLFGSVMLFFDALKCACSAKLADGLTLGNYLDLITTAVFLFAAIMGGGFVFPPLIYKITPQVVKEGMMLWLVGSLCCIIAPARVVVYGPSPSEPSLPTSLPMSSNEHYGAVQHESSSHSLTSSDGDTSEELGGDNFSRRS